ncbi:hypothetical protein GCM10010109_64740 [Actinoplanes campanulatus]|nr:hypothetical protein GCM10010109_64740 [Actinoplanes campanulatus]GID39680.1 hypothetical protein Aca09nite_61860 [Actinoplanes campanulatus]
MAPKRRSSLPPHAEPVTDGPAPASAAPTDGELGDLSEAVMTALLQSTTGRPADAATTLHPYVTTIDLAQILAEPNLIDACTLYATLTTGTEQMRAAHHAYHASHVLYPCGHPRRLAAADAYGATLHQHGLLTEAIDVRRRVLAGYRIHQPQRALTAAIDLAASLHTAGRCTDALNTLAGAWHTWHHHPQPDTSTGTAVLAAFMRALRACRQDLHLLALLAQARDTPAWDDLVTSHTAQNAAADTAYIDAHRTTVCTHTPQTLTAASPESLPGQALPIPARLPPRSPAQTPPRAPATNGHDAPRRHPLTGYRVGDIAGAISRMLTAPEAVFLLTSDRTPQPDDGAARQRLTDTIAAYLAHRRARRAALRTAAILLLVIAVAVLVHLVA